MPQGWDARMASLFLYRPLSALRRRDPGWRAPASAPAQPPPLAPSLRKRRARRLCAYFAPAGRSCQGRREIVSMKSSAALAATAAARCASRAPAIAAS